MDWRLKGEGAAFPTAQALGEPSREADSIRVRFRAGSELPIASAEVYWSGGEMPWRMRWWEPAPTREVRPGVYEALLPVRHVAKRLDWVGVISDEGSATVSTRIERIQPADVGFAPDAAGTSVTLDDLQPLVAIDRWRWAAGTRRSGENFGYGREPGGGLRITGNYVIGAWGLRAADIEAAGAAGVRLQVRSASETPVDSLRVGLTVEVENGERYFFNAQSAEGLQIGPAWQLLQLAWSDFRCEDAAVDLMSDGLGELRLTVSGEGATVHVDEVRFF